MGWVSRDCYLIVCLQLILNLVSWWDWWLQLSSKCSWIDSRVLSWRELARLIHRLENLVQQMIMPTTKDLWVSILLLLLLLLVTLAALMVFVNNELRKKWPPGPRPVPILGNLLELKELPHQSLSALAARYGGLMYLCLGMVMLSALDHDFWNEWMNVWEGIGRKKQKSCKQDYCLVMDGHV